jgi:tRNA dimethylallyltransferase
LGPTASGKTALALELAERFNGEIIAADSRTIYKGMDIATAKPTPEERRLAPHHLLDVVEPSRRFTVADFQKLANQAILDVGSRHKLPILVGGTGLYIDSVIYGFRFRGNYDPVQREALAGESVEELQKILREKGVVTPENSRNPRHLIRAIEANGVSSTRSSLRPKTLVLGIDIEMEVLQERVAERVEAMVSRGLVDEIRKLVDVYGWDAPALQIPAVKAFRPYLEGNASLEEAKQQFVQYDRQYAKRQKTWFKRNDDIRWISKKAQAVDLVTTLLSK